MRDKSVERVRRRVKIILRNTVITEMRAKKSTKNYSSDWEPGPSWDGGETVHGTRKEPIWDKLVDLVLKNGCDPVRFIQVQFEGARQVPRYANQLASPAALRRYQESVAMEGKTIGQDLQMQLNRFQLEAGLLQDAGFERKDSWILALTDEELPFSALFRYCASRHVKHEQSKTIRKTYFRQAQLQYLAHWELYNECWKEFISEKFRKWAIALGKKLGMKC